jgi:hypothetical protein
MYTPLTLFGWLTTWGILDAPLYKYNDYFIQRAGVKVNQMLECMVGSSSTPNQKFEDDGGDATQIINTSARNAWFLNKYVQGAMLMDEPLF